MKIITIFTSVLVLFMILTIGVPLKAQVDVDVIIRSGKSESVCTDILTPPDNLWQVKINNMPWRTYPDTLVCFNEVPDTFQLLQSACPAQLPGFIDVCLKTFENDGLNNTCRIDEVCLRDTCGQFALPAVGDSINYTLRIAPPPGYDPSAPLTDSDASWGFVTFTVKVTNNFYTDNDFICDALDLGALTGNSPIGSLNESTYNNLCGTGLGDVDPSINGAFSNEAGVWFQFTTGNNPKPLTLVQGASDPGNQGDQIDMELAVYTSATGECNGSLELLDWVRAEGKGKLELPIFCPEPNQTYFILVDGNNTEEGIRGFFGLRVSEVALDVPTSYIDTTICLGEDIRVGNSIYTESGSYVDTIPLQGSCDSLVYTELLVRTLPVARLEILRPASAEGQNDGQFRLNLMGADTSHLEISWCTGETGMFIQNGIGGDSCCVSIRDTLANCMIEVCEWMPFLDPLKAVVTTDSVTCFGFQDGRASIEITGGTGTYQIQIPELTDCTACRDSVNAGEAIVISGLEKGTYTLQVKDAFLEDTFTFTIAEPDAVQVAIAEVQQPGCEGNCDGVIEISPGGGNGGYSYFWSDATIDAPRRTELCPGVYEVFVIDRKGCRNLDTFRIDLPPAFVAELRTVQEVSCEGARDGTLDITANAEISSYQWSTGSTAPTLTDLSLGNYDVTVESINGCEEVLSTSLDTYLGSLEVEITQIKDNNCPGDFQAALQATPGGLGTNFSYQWNTGGEAAVLDGLRAGTYRVEVTNEVGCNAQAEWVINELPLISATLVTPLLKCNDPEDGGSIEVKDLAGGTPTYEYALDGISFQNSPFFNRLLAGPYTLTVRDAQGCEQDFSTTIEAASTLNVDLGPDMTLMQGDSVMLFAEAARDGNLAYRWSVNNTRDDLLPQEDNWVQPYQTSDYVVEITEEETGCSARDTVRVEVLQPKSTYAPTAFSPNQDGINDIFVLFPTPDVRKVYNYRVFDRTGALIYKANEVLLAEEAPNTGWDGTFRGEPMPTGVYVWTAELEFVDGKRNVISGDFMLVR